MVKPGGCGFKSCRARGGSVNIEYLGKHTVVSYLNESGAWKDVPYLRDNNGHLPGLLIAVGDRRRVKLAEKFLENTIFLDEYAKKFDESFEGRVKIAIGTLKRNKKNVAICIAETQMGTSAAQIILREIAAHMSLRYVIGNESVELKNLYAIRVGSCGGINDGSFPNIKTGDIVSCTYSLGDINAIAQSLGCLNRNDSNAKKMKAQWKNYGEDFKIIENKDEFYFLGECSKEIREKIKKISKEKGVEIFEGGNFTKDSLYAEVDEKTFEEKRKKYSAITTEMEMLALHEIRGLLKRKRINLEVGGLLCVVGTIPGGSFSSDEEENKKIKNSEAKCLEIAMNALAEIATQ